MIRKVLKKHICVDILIFDKTGQLALQKRSLVDDSFPGHWDFSSGGHIDENETSEKAAERELWEELGIKTPLRFVKKEKFIYPDWKPGITSEVDADIYKGIYEGKFKINPGEVAEIVFFKIDEIENMFNRGEKFHPEFALAWKKGVVSLSQK